MNDDDWKAIDSYIEGLGQRVQEIESLAKSLFGKDCVFFQRLSLNPPHRGCAELVFLRIVFWLYGLLHECGGSPIRCCRRQSQFHGGEEHELAYLDELKALRTHAAHNLDSSSESDKVTEYTCLQWYRRVCKSTPPMQDAAWVQCTLSVVSGGEGLLRKVSDFFTYLMNTPDCNQLIKEVDLAIRGQISPYLFDSIVASVATDLGRSGLNFGKFRAHHQKFWIDSFGKLAEAYDFQHEARRLVEVSFLENPERSPVSGRDIIEQLEVPRGPEVGRLLKVADQIFESGTRDKIQILKQLRENIGSIDSGACDD